jgi:hypothetical protein
VYRVEFYRIPYIRAYIWSWHTWPDQKEATSCTRFYIQDWRWIGNLFNSNPCDLISLYWFLRQCLNLFKISCRAEVVILRVGVSPPPQSWHLLDTTSELTSSGWHLTHLAFDLGQACQKVRLYGTFVSGLHHLPPQMKNQHRLNEEKTFVGKKWSLNWVPVMWHVWLVWILTTKHKTLKRVENFERYVICSCHYLLILLNTRFLFCCVYLLFRFIFQTDLLSGYLSSSICSTLNPDCSFLFEWHNF